MAQARYFTSSNRVKKFREKHGEPDVVQVRKTFGEGAENCRRWEERVLMKIKKNTGAKWLNTRVSNKGWFSPTGSVVSRNIVTGVVSRVTVDEFQSNPDLVGQTHGMVPATNADGERVYVSKGEYASRTDLVHHMAGYVPSDEARKAASNRMSGKVFAKTISGDVIHVSKDEFRTNHDLVGANTGYTQPIDARQKIAESKIGKPRPRHVGEAVGKAKNLFTFGVFVVIIHLSSTKRLKDERHPAQVPSAWSLRS